MKALSLYRTKVTTHYSPLPLLVGGYGVVYAMFALFVFCTVRFQTTPVPAPAVWLKMGQVFSLVHVAFAVALMIDIASHVRDRDRPARRFGLVAGLFALALVVGIEVLSRGVLWMPYG